ncbi:MAG: hypothetical protein ACXVBW_06080 [Bdellovibrionota bacterium]
MPRKPAQTSLFSHPRLKAFERRTEHGSGIRERRRKLARPIAKNRCLHLTLRSERAKGHWSLFQERNERHVKHLVHALARKRGVRIYQYANSGNHLHILLHPKSGREEFQRYLKTLTGLIARHVTGARKGQAKGKFWDGLAYTRLVEWGRDFINAKRYVIQNEDETKTGHYMPRPRKRGPPRRS